MNPFKSLYRFFTHIFRFMFDKQYRKSLRKQKAYARIAMDDSLPSHQKAKAIAAKSLEEILQDEKARENALIWAQFFERKFRGKRFTADQALRAVRKTGGFDIASMNDHLTLLTMFKVLVREEIRIGKPTIYYKAVLSLEHRAKILKQQADLLRKRADLVEEDI